MVVWFAVLVLAGGLAGCGSDSASVSGAPPAHHTISVSTGTPTAEPVSTDEPAFARAALRLVDSSRARLVDFAAIPGHPLRRIAEWSLCPDGACHRLSYALAVTDDGFRTSHGVQVAVTRVANGWCLEPAGGDHFAISPNCGQRRLVDLSGRTTPVRRTGSSGPLTGHEVPLRSAKTGFAAVDPVSGASHPLSTPSGTVELEETPHGQLRVTTVDAGYFWSGDRGATWHAIPVPVADRDLMTSLVPTTTDRVQALELGGDGATLFPWDHVLRSVDGRTWTSYDGPGRPHAYGGTTAVLPDGQLLLQVDAWSDQRAGQPASRPIGLYAGTDWGRLAPVGLSGPFATEDPDSYDLDVFDVAVTSHEVTLYARTPDERGAAASGDGGRSWRPVRAR
ncbi:MAG: hypothetical protein QM747_00855 [Nocardioides sp.]